MFAKTRDLAPDRIVLFGFVNPLEGEKALELIDRQYFDLGAKAFKFYPMDPFGGPSGWWCDDSKIAHPVWEKILSLGMRYVSVHKLPLPMIANKWQDPSDVDAAAASFPELNFIIYHMGYPEIEKVANICANRPNVYADFGGPLVPSIVFKPEWFSDQLCKFLAVAPLTKLCWGSDMMISPGGQEYIDAMWNWQVPERYQIGYGIEPISNDQKKLILGGTFANIAGIDIPKQLGRISNDDFSNQRTDRVKKFLEMAC
jgi:predicted TIM-barrel fold metal-dependent hydrolase